jgi:hypothetical protein
MGAQAVPCLKHYPNTSTATTLPEENLAPTNRDDSGNNRASLQAVTAIRILVDAKSEAFPTWSNRNGLQL